MTKPLGYIVYDGPSMLDGSPIVCIATSLTGSNNDKTGDMAQFWILRSDMSPVDALLYGDDSGVCGKCPQRHANEICQNCGHDHGIQPDNKLCIKCGTRLDGGCYVVPFQAPRSIYAAYMRGRYETILPVSLGAMLANIKKRFGAYGDPAAVPLFVWESIVSYDAVGWTGYTHQWLTCDPGYSRILMASVDNDRQHAMADALGWRGFRSLPEGADLPAKTAWCPAMTHGVQCADCMLCDGTATKARHMAVPIHGQRAAQFAA